MQVATNRKSKVDLLPKDIRDTLNAFIRSGDMQQKDILEAINQMIDEAGLGDDAKLSRSGFNRHAQKVEAIATKIRESREVAEVIVSKLGDGPESKLGELLQETIRHLAFNVSMKMVKGEEAIDTKVLNQLALLSNRVEQAAMTSMKREKEIRKAFAEEMADKTEQVAKKAGLTSETVKMLKAELLGIA